MSLYYNYRNTSYAFNLFGVLPERTELQRSPVSIFDLSGKEICKECLEECHIKQPSHSKSNSKIPLQHLHKQQLITEELEKQYFHTNLKSQLPDIQYVKDAYQKAGERHQSPQ